MILQHINVFSSLKCPLPWTFFTYCTPFRLRILKKILTKLLCNCFILLVIFPMRVGVLAPYYTLWLKWYWYIFLSFHLPCERSLLSASIPLSALSVVMYLKVPQAFISWIIPPLNQWSAFFHFSYLQLLRRLYSGP